MAYCTSCGSQVDAQDRFCSECGRELAARGPTAPSVAPSSQTSAGPKIASGPTAFPSPTPPKADKRRWLIALGSLLAVALVVAIVVLVGGGGNDESGHERVCVLTSEFWEVVDNDEGRTELDRLIAIAQQMGEGIDDEAEAEGFDDIAENATEAAIGGSFADATGSTDAMFTALENLEGLCGDLGLGGAPSTDDADPAGDEVAADESTEDQSSEREPAAGPSATPGDCPAQPTERIGAEQAARCTYEAYIQADRELALVYADSAAVDLLFETAWEPPEWEFGGCELDGIESSTGAACYYFICDDFHGVQVEMLLGGGPSAGNFVEEVNFYG